MIFTCSIGIEIIDLFRSSITISEFEYEMFEMTDLQFSISASPKILKLLKNPLMARLASLNNVTNLNQCSNSVERENS